ncbi:MAG: 4-hydroxy-3-methylbut-2-enyl diphosphate reductase [Holophagaceae bacterium]|nr:4-hydroxy-3-methylbut-2-enyl diphosphate reductase [Holophagaceae bacterium]
MKVMVARTAGFCWGVRRAMDAVLEASSRQEGPVRTLGPLIHNPQALSLLKKRGVGVVDNPEDAQDGTVVIRAHGIPVQDLQGLRQRQQAGEINLVNATCPEVAKVHARIRKWSPKGYYTVILGSHGHAESVAHQSFAAHGSTIVANLEEARALTDEQLAKVLVVAQTTFTTKDYAEITEYLRSRAGEALFENTICQDTTRRQAEAQDLAKVVDYVIVVGGKNSSNTKHLAELARHYGKPVQFVETAADLDLTVFSGSESVGVLAGASTPTWLVEEVVDVLEALGKGPGTLGRFLKAAFASPTVMAVGAGFMTLGIHHWMGTALAWQYPVLTGCYTWAMYLLTPYLDPMGVGSKGPARARFLERNRAIILGAGVLSLAVALGLSLELGLGSLILVLVASLFGLTYKRGIHIGTLHLSLRAIPGSKDLLVALALALVAVALPLWHHDWAWDGSAWAGLLLVAGQAFARTSIHNIRDMQNDQIMGRETLPILLGKRAATWVLGAVMAIALSAALIFGPGAQIAHPWAARLILVVASVYPLAHLWLYHERFSAGKAIWEPSVEISFYLLGCLILF